MAITRLLEAAGATPIVDCRARLLDWKQRDWASEGYHLLFGILFASVLLGADPSDPSAVEFFERKIRPVLVAKCYECHSGRSESVEGGLRLDSRQGLNRGGEHGPAVVPGQPESSLLIRAIRHREPKMPPSGRLPRETIQDFERWVASGALYSAAIASDENESSAGEYWAFRPLATKRPPVVQDLDWCRTRIDNFVLARLEAAGLSPAPTAARSVLLRRVTYDLTGLPPTQQEIEAFTSDTRPDAYARVVDRLLASPHYGEKWGRHWLDVARYANSSGVDEDYRHPFAWRNRDYVIGAFNGDMPYDQFVTEQLAGDVLSDRNSFDPNKIIATGFLALGPKALAQQDKVQMVYDVVDEQIDTMSKAFLALTVSCARCHDHKFDPITTEDYYSLASIFASTKTYSRTVGLVSEFYEAGLAPKRQVEAYNEFRRKTNVLAQQIKATAYPEVVAYRRGRLWPRLADYMIAARSVTVKNRDLEDVANEDHLDERLLAKWVRYLYGSQDKEDRKETDDRSGAARDENDNNADGDEKAEDERPHLADFLRAGDETAGDVAQRYQREALTKSVELHERLIQWRNDVNAAVQSGKPLPRLSNDEFIKGPFHREVAILPEGPFAVSEKAWEKAIPVDAWRRIQQLRESIEHLERNAPPKTETAQAVAEGEPVQQAVFIRGDHRKRGKIVPKQFPAMLAGPSQQPITKGSGRLELAQWLTGKASHLTSRVMVNRIWLWHFGQGLVRTPDNFGIVGEEPTHPELLDYLAVELRRSGWSIKHLHRLILLSSAYQMDSQASQAAWQSDADNRLWSRFDRRRLTAEEIRDSLLQLSGQLDRQMGGTLQPELGDSRVGSNSDIPPYLDPDDSRRRTVYLPLYRNRLPRSLTLFNFVDSTVSTGQRTSTNIALQSLFFLNSEFVDRCASGFAKRLVDLDTSPSGAARPPAGKPAAVIRRAYLMCFARQPDPSELKLAATYLKQYPKASGDGEAGFPAAVRGLCRVLMASNELLYVD